MGSNIQMFEQIWTQPISALLSVPVDCGVPRGSTEVGVYVNRAQYVS